MVPHLFLLSIVKVHFTEESYSWDKVYQEARPILHPTSERSCNLGMPELHPWKLTKTTASPC
jgi:hypothetical protein